MIRTWLTATAIAAASIALALQIFIATSAVFTFARDTAAFVFWFSFVQALALLFASRLVHRHGAPSKGQAALITTAVAFAVGPFFKHLVAPFLYEPFRSFRVYVLFFASYGALVLLTRGAALASAWRRRELRLPGPAAFLLVSAAIFAVGANPIGFQGAYPRVVQGLRNLLFYGEGRLPYALAPAIDASFEQPIAVRADPGDPNVLIVAERPGRLKKVSRASGARAEVVLDLTQTVGELGDERGLSNFALHPRFAADQPFVFVTFTAGAAAKSTNRLSRFTARRGAGGLEIERASELILIDQDDRDQLHNGGGLAFGPDGFLYVGVGDEGGFNDPFENSQRLDRGLFSGILRLDVDRRGGAVSRPPARQPAGGRTAGYDVPLDNPFTAMEGALAEFWALGLRNPFRLSFDGAGRLWVADVGQNNFEEIDLVEKGDNLGWSAREGPAPNAESRFRGARPDPFLGREKEPLYFYRHSGANVCVVGGFVYEGRTLDALAGRYLFADLAGEIHALELRDGAVQGEELIAIAPSPGFGISGLFPVGDEVLVTVLGGVGDAPGRIMRLAPHGTAGTVAVDRDRVVTIDEKYATFCARCHGAFGKPSAASGGAPPRDFTDAAWQGRATDADVARVIRDGGAAVGLSAEMPAWKDVLNEDETRAMVAKIRAFKRP